MEALIITTVTKLFLYLSLSLCLFSTTTECCSLPETSGSWASSILKHLPRNILLCKQSIQKDGSEECLRQQSFY